MTPVSKTDMASQRMRYHLSRLQTSPQFSAVIDFLFDLEPRTEPRIAELAVVDDRLIVARAVGDIAFRHYLGSRRQLEVNLVGFVDHLRLGANELEYVLARIEAIPARSAA
jgi:hypothetical protein